MWGLGCRELRCGSLQGPEDVEVQGCGSRGCGSVGAWGPEEWGYCLTVLFVDIFDTLLGLIL